MGQMRITSPAFDDRGEIPARYTCDGSDVNPPLSIEGVPSEAKSLALVVDDPDAPSGMWVHWVVWNIPPTLSVIAENEVPSGCSMGLNDWRRTGYGGPCPPTGTHRYFFRLYALDTLLSLPSSTTKNALERAFAGHVLAKAELQGTYRRR